MHCTPLLKNYLKIAKELAPNPSKTPQQLALKSSKNTFHCKLFGNCSASFLAIIVEKTCLTSPRTCIKSAKALPQNSIKELAPKSLKNAP